MFTPVLTVIEEGTIMDYTNTTANTINPGDPVPMAACFGVAIPAGGIPGIPGTPIPAGIAPGATGPVVVRGVVQGPADSTVSFNNGDKVYWDPANKFFTSNATGTDVAGYAWAAKATGVNVARVKLPY